MTAPHPWSSGSEGGRLQEACGVLFKTTGQGQPGIALMPVSCGSDCSPHPRGQEIDFETKDSSAHFTHHTVFCQKGGHWLSPSCMLKYQTVLMEQEDAELKVTTVVNPAQVLNIPMQEEQLTLDCLHTVEQVYVS